MNNQDIYLWGTLLALVREQLAAVDKHLNGRLGIWGRARFHARTKEMGNFVIKLLQHKAQSYGDGAVDALHADLATIENDSHAWQDVTSQELEYVRVFLADLTR